MAFRDFRFPDVLQTFGLTLSEAELYRGVPPVELSAEFAARLADGVELAVGIDTEKARSEFIIAPMLQELRSRSGRSFGLFSGVQFDVDVSRGLNGYCDFILTRSSVQVLLTAPVVAITEAKVDNVRTGYAQCISGMVAAREFNTLAGTPIDTVYGVATTGTAWKFLALTGSNLTFDRDEYYITDPGRILGILARLVSAPGPR